MDNKIKLTEAVARCSEEERKRRWEEYRKETKAKVEFHELSSEFESVLKESIYNQRNQTM